MSSTSDSQSEINLIFSQKNDSDTRVNYLTYNLPVAFNSSGNEVSLRSIAIYYSWRNITIAYGNNTVNYVWCDGSTNVITIPDGNYTIEQINNEIQFQMTQNTHYLINGGVNVYYISLVNNPSRYANELTITPLPSSIGSYSYPPGATWTVNGFTPQLVIPTFNLPNPNFTTSSFGQVIGFSAGTYPVSPITSIYQRLSDLVPQLDPAYALYLCTNLINNQDFSVYPQALHSFTAGNTDYGGLIEINPQWANWIKVIDQQFPSISVFFTDQNYNPLNIIDLDITVVLVVRKSDDYKTLRRLNANSLHDTKVSSDQLYNKNVSVIPPSLPITHVEKQIARQGGGLSFNYSDLKPFRR